MRKVILTCIVFIMMLFMLVQPQICIEGATSGLLLWFQKLLPSLLPFIILINLLCSLGILFKFARFLTPITKKLFQLSGNGFIVFLLGLMSGYPMGAKLAKTLLDQGEMTYDEAQKSLCYSCNCGPLFIIGTVGTLMLGNTHLGYFLLLVHFASAFIMLLLSRFYTLPETKKGLKNDTPIPALSFSTAFTSAVQNGMDTIVYVGGYIIFFSMLCNILAHSSLYIKVTQILSSCLSIDPTLIHSFLLSTLEFSSGSARLTTLLPYSTTLLALLSAIIAFGGFCVCFQSQHVLQGSNLSIKPYLYSKILQSLIAYILTFIIYPFFETSTYPSFSLKWYILLCATLLFTGLLFKLLSRTKHRLKAAPILS